MQTLRHFTLIARLVLAWFVLSLGVAVASPLFSPQGTQLVCTGSGAMKVLVTADDGSTSEVVSNTMDFPLCAGLSAPPPVARAVVEPVAPVSHVVQSTPAAHPAARLATLSARGPPQHS